MVTQKLRVHVIAAFASALLFGGQALAGTPHISIDNFGKVNNNYYRGAQPKGAD